MPKRGQIWVLLGMFILPIALYFLFMSVTRPVFAPVAMQYSITDTGDSILQKVSDFTLIDQNGKPFTRKDMEGYIYYISFFSLQDTLAAKMINGGLYKVYDNARDAEMVRFLSITTQAENDRIERLKRYADSIGVTSPKWIFASAPDSVVRSIATEGLRFDELDYTKNHNQGKLFPTPMVAYIDKLGRVRNYYVVTSLSEARKMNQDLWALLRLEYQEDFE